MRRNSNRRSRSGLDASGRAPRVPCRGDPPCLGPLGRRIGRSMGESRATRQKCCSSDRLDRAKRAPWPAYRNRRRPHRLFSWRRSTVDWMMEADGTLGLYLLYRLPRLRWHVRCPVTVRAQGEARESAAREPQQETSLKRPRRDQEIGRLTTADAPPRPVAGLVSNARAAAQWTDAARAGGLLGDAVRERTGKPAPAADAANGDVIVAEQMPGYLTLLRDGDGDGRAE